MRKIAWTVALLIAGYVALALSLDAYIGAAQPTLDNTEGVLTTLDEAGGRHDTRLTVIEDGDTLWVQSGHYFRGWYERLLANPDVTLDYRGASSAYRAVALDTPEAREHVSTLIKARNGTATFYAIRAVLLFAEIKPVRLDPAHRPDSD